HGQRVHAAHHRHAAARCHRGLQVLPPRGARGAAARPYQERRLLVPDRDALSRVEARLPHHRDADHLHRPAGGAVEDVAAHGVGSGIHGVETAPRPHAGANQVTVSIIIVTYNSARVIGACLDSLAADCASGLAEAIVVDNASADDSVQVVRTRYPWATLVESR